MKDVVEKVLRELMDINNTKDIMDIIKTAIARVFNTNWPIDAFAKTKVYRPDKKNISVTTMIERYRDSNYHTVPEPNVRFKYVICKYYPWTFDIQGRIESKMSIGDRMELLERVIDEGLEIDLEYYFDNELTGQFARLITFCDEFKDSVPVIEEVDTSNMTEIEIDVINKEHYQRKEDALFKAAKKYISQLAKHYSKAYVNKGSLFKNTWVEVGKFIGSHPEIQNRHLSSIHAIVSNMLATASSDKDSNIYNGLMNWASQHVMTKYQTTLTNEQNRNLKKLFQKIQTFVEDRGIAKALVNPIDTWKRRVVEFIHEEYGYEYICKHNLPFDTLWDVMSRQELELIIQMNELFPSMTEEDGMKIIDMVSVAIAKVLPTECMQMR